MFENAPFFKVVFVRPEIEAIAKDTVKDTVSDTIKDTISDTQMQILALVTENSRITIKAISKEVGINERNVKKNIKELKDLNLIDRIGTNRSGNWEVK